MDETRTSVDGSHSPSDPKPTLTLPSEIIGTIVDLVSDRETLTSLAICSRIISRHAIRALYRELPYFYSRDNFEKALLSISRPHLSRHLRVINLSLTCMVPLEFLTPSESLDRNYAVARANISMIDGELQHLLISWGYRFARNVSTLLCSCAQLRKLVINCTLETPVVAMLEKVADWHPSRTEYIGFGTSRRDRFYRGRERIYTSFAHGVVEALSASRLPCLDTLTIQSCDIRPVLFFPLWRSSDNDPSLWYNLSAIKNLHLAHAKDHLPISEWLFLSSRLSSPHKFSVSGGVDVKHYKRNAGVNDDDRPVDILAQFHNIRDFSQFSVLINIPSCQSLKLSNIVVCWMTLYPILEKLVGLQEAHLAFILLDQVPHFSEHQPVYNTWERAFDTLRGLLQLKMIYLNGLGYGGESKCQLEASICTGREGGISALYNLQTCIAGKVSGAKIEPEVSVCRECDAAATAGIKYSPGSGPQW